MKRILLCTDGSDCAHVGYQYVAWLAQRMELEVEVLYVSDIREQKPNLGKDFSGSIGIGAYENLLDKLVVLEQEKAKINHETAKIILADAQKFLQQNGVDRVHLTHRTGLIVDCLHEFEKDADLVVLGKRGKATAVDPEHLGANLERIIKSSKKPCLVTPGAFQNIERLLLAYDGSKSCQKALQILVDFPGLADLELHIVNVSKRGESEGKKIVEQAAATLKPVGFQPICQVLSGDTEKVITQYVKEKRIDGLIMGAYGHNRLRYLVTGSTTDQMLHNCDIPVLLLR